MLNERLIMENLNTLHEHTMAKDIFVPVLKAMGCDGVRFTGGTNEQGIDIEYYELTKPEKFKSYVGIQFKKGNLVYSAGGKKNSIREIKNQAEEAFEKGIPAVNSAKIHYIGRFVVATTGEINDKAREMINKAKLKGDGRRINYWDMGKLAEYIQDYWLDEFVEYFSINVNDEVENTDEILMIDKEYILENYPELVKKCRKVKATISGLEWEIIDVIMKEGKFSDDSSVSISDLLFELERSEDYIRDEIINLRRLDYIEVDDDCLYISGKAIFLNDLADKIIEEIQDAEEDDDSALDIYNELL